MNEEDHYCLRWSNHQPTVMGVFDSLLRAETLVDVTLASEGKWLRAHRLVLSACSEYFQELLTFQPEKNAILYLRDVPFSHLEAIIAFMYRGEVNISHSELSNFIKTADSLRIRGLSDIYHNQSELASQTDEQPANPPVNRTSAPSQTSPSDATSNSATDSPNRSSTSSARRPKRLRSESPHEPINVRLIGKNGFQEKRIPVVQLTPIDARTCTDRRITTTQSQPRNTAQITLPKDPSTQSDSAAPVLNDEPPMVSIPASASVDPSLLEDLLCNVVPKIELEEVDLDTVTLDNAAGGGEEDWSDLEGQGTSHAELEGLETQEGTSSTTNDRSGNEFRQGRHLSRINLSCQKCGQSFVLRKNLIKHAKNCAQMIDQRVCKSCDTCFSSHYSLRRHLRTVHGINQGKKMTQKKSV